MTRRRQEEVADEAVSLESMVKAITARRQSHLEKMGNGLQERDYLEHVGRAKECAWLITEAQKRVKQLYAGGHDEDEE